MYKRYGINPGEFTPEVALTILKKGNDRFQNNLKMHRDMLQQVNMTSENQFPFAVILSCMDSRTSAELIFDLGLGDIMSIRIGGNIATRSIIGSIEFACKIAGSKLVLVMGHTNCGAIKGVCDGVGDGNIAVLLNKIKPVLNKQELVSVEERHSGNSHYVNRVAELNVHHTISYIKSMSPVLSSMEKAGQIKFAGALYDVSTGIVDFYDEG
ncbi:MAG: carbonic anhydrase family protein [Flavobacteriales bacterium]